MLASLPDGVHRALVTLAGFGILTLVVYRADLSLTARRRVAYAEAALVGVAAAANGGAQSPLLPYLLAPGLALGLLAGPRAAAQGALLAAAALAGARFVADGTAGASEFGVAAGQWVLLGLAVGLVAAWAGRLVAVPATTADRYAEVRGLLQQLRTVTRGLPGGLDPGAAAETLLEESARLAPHARSAVLVQTVQGGALVPVAVRGTRRVPWRAPLTAPGPLRDAWETHRPAVDRRPPDKHGRRQGSALAAVPLVGSSAPFGLVVLEGHDEDALPDEQIELVIAATADVALRLETALLFDEVRSVASAEERDRLAREIHDGIAQDLAFLGYQLDELRTLAARSDELVAAKAGDLRKQMTELINNLRLSITDLKTSVSADRGLGAALGSYVRAISTGRQLTVHLSLQESAFRLPAEREVALFRVAQIVAQDVRQTGRAGNLWVTLSVDPPSAQLVVEHDGMSGTAATDLTEVGHALEQLGGHLAVNPRPQGGLRVEAGFEGDDDDDQGPAGR